MADLTPERIAELRRLSMRRLSMLPATSADDDDCVTEWHCSGCEQMSTRCRCDETLAKAVPALLDEVERLRAERDRYHDALVARHGGEPVALLAALDSAKAELERLQRENAKLRHAMQQIAERLKAISQWDDPNPWLDQPAPAPIIAKAIATERTAMLHAIRDAMAIATQATEVPDV